MKLSNLILVGGLAAFLISKVASPLSSSTGTLPATATGPTVPQLISGNAYQGTVAAVSPQYVVTGPRSIDVMTLSRWQDVTHIYTNQASQYRLYLSNLLPFPLPGSVQTYGVTNGLPDINTVNFNANSIRNVADLAKLYGYNVNVLR